LILKMDLFPSAVVIIYNFVFLLPLFGLFFFRLKKTRFINFPYHQSESTYISTLLNITTQTSKAESWSHNPLQYHQRLHKHLPRLQAAAAFYWVRQRQSLPMVKLYFVDRHSYLDRYLVSRVYKIVTFKLQFFVNFVIHKKHF
jgi:hypothetical protein